MANKISTSQLRQNFQGSIARSNAKREERTRNFEQFPEVIKQAFRIHAIRENKINLSTFWPRLFCFKPDNFQIDELRFNPKTLKIDTNLEPLVKQLKELASLYTDYHSLKTPEILSALQEIDLLYNFLMKKFHPERALFDLPSPNIDINLENENRSDIIKDLLTEPNSISKELTEIVKKPKNFLKFFVFTAIICLFALSTVPAFIGGILFLGLAITIYHFQGVEKRHRQWHAMKKLRDISKKLCTAQSPKTLTQNPNRPNSRLEEEKSSCPTPRTPESPASFSDSQWTRTPSRTDSGRHSDSSLHRSPFTSDEEFSVTRSESKASESSGTEITPPNKFEDVYHV